MQIDIKYHADIIPLKMVENGDWIDLRVAEDVRMRDGEFKIISLGVSMKLPEGYEAHIVPRSSTFKTWGIIQTNHMGVIDNSYCGDDDVWGFPAFATHDVFIPKNSRICQFRLMKKMESVTFSTVDTLNSVSRGGFGHSGTI
jgi:dUTP pyrophosphatase